MRQSTCMYFDREKHIFKKWVQIVLHHDITKQKVDMFSGFRGWVNLQGVQVADVIPEGQRLYDDYELQWGGSHWSFGMTIEM